MKIELYLVSCFVNQCGAEMGQVFVDGRVTSLARCWNYRVAFFKLCGGNCKAKVER